MKNKDLYLSLSLMVLLIVTYIIGLTQNWIVGVAFYVGFILLLICIFSAIKFPKYSSYILAVTLIASMLRVVQFTPFQVHLQISALKLNPIPIPFLIVFMLLNRSRIMDIFQGSNPTKEEIAEESRIRHLRFKADFQKLSVEEISKRLQFNLTDEARKALMELQEERKNQI